MTYSFLRASHEAFVRLMSKDGLAVAFDRSAIELPGGINDSSCHEKVDYSCFSALCIGDGAGFLRERF